MYFIIQNNCLPRCVTAFRLSSLLTQRDFAKWGGLQPAPVTQTKEALAKSKSKDAINCYSNVNKRRWIGFEAQEVPCLLLKNYGFVYLNMHWSTLARG